MHIGKNAVRTGSSGGCDEVENHWSYAHYNASLLSVGVPSTQQLLAQNSYGSIVGTVTDATGAVVPGATVTITDVAMSEKCKTPPNDTGDFSSASVLGSSWTTLAAEETIFNIPATYFGNIQGGNDVPCNAGVTVCAPVVEF